MRLKHILVEGYCNFDNPPNNYPCSHCGGKLGVYCLGCPEFSYTPAPHELAMTNELGVVETLSDWASPYLDVGDYNGVTKKDLDECKQLWKDICRQKIADAWNEFCSASKLK